MIIIDTAATPILEFLGKQVLDLVADNLTELAMAHPPPSHPLFSVYRLVLLTEMRAYLAWPTPSQMEVVTAIEDGKLLGFVLCGLSPGRECGIYYTAVSKTRRNEGIMSLMIRDVVSRYSAISLSCDVQLVPKYEHYGFEPRSLRKHQVVMVIGDPQEETPVIDPDDLQRQPSILEEQLAASARSTEHAVNMANKGMKRFLKAEEAKAKQYMQHRLGRGARGVGTRSNAQSLIGEN
jgi:ribosomal protein S18 acetylase RimI-like enzyme